MNARESNEAPFYAGLIVALFYSLGLLLPYAVVGQTWATMWFILAIPFSTIAEDTAGLSVDTPELILAVTMTGAIVWGTLAFVMTKLLRLLLR